MKDDFVASGRSVSDMKAHLVLTTKYRRKVLDGEMLVRLAEIVSDLCDKWGCDDLTVRKTIFTYSFSTTLRWSYPNLSVT